MKIYTKTGDTGFTSLYTGQRVPKNDPIIDAIGIVDECNSSIGVAIAFLPKEVCFDPIKEELETIQHALFDVGAALATPQTRASEKKIEKTRFDEESTERLEGWIDFWETKLPPLKTFILPGGHQAGALLHMARTNCRTAERLVAPLQQNAEVSLHVLRYLNRLSDYLFVISRVVNQMTKMEETPWFPHKGHHS
jgi:cob(I)alamin adenosyltransferase